MAACQSVSIIIPCYNEELIIERNVARLDEFMSRRGLAYEIVLCNDGSRDRTAEILERLARERRTVKAVGYAQNRGAGFAFRTALAAATGDCLIHMDADLAMDPEEVLQPIVDRLAAADIAIASRYMGMRADYPLYRRIPSFVYRLIFRSLLGLPIRDAMSGFFGVRRTVIEAIPPLQMDGFEVYVELFLRARQRGFKIDEFPAKFRHDTKSGEVSVLAHAPRQLMNTLRIFARVRLGLGGA